MNARPIGVVIPPRNCRDRLPARLQPLRQWSDRGTQVVVVDTESTDGTFEHVHDCLRDARQDGLSSVYHGKKVLEIWGVNSWFG